MARRQTVGCDAATLVSDRDRDVGVFARRRDPDGGRFRGVPGGVGEKVVEHLYDAPAVGHGARKVDGEVDGDAGQSVGAHRPA